MGNVPDTPLRRAMLGYGLTAHEARRWVHIMLMPPDRRTAAVRHVIGRLEGEEAVGQAIADYVRRGTSAQPGAARP